MTFSDHVSDCIYIGLLGDQAPGEEGHIPLEAFSENGGMCTCIYDFPQLFFDGYIIRIASTHKRRDNCT